MDQQTKDDLKELMDGPVPVLLLLLFIILTGVAIWRGW